MKAAAETKLPRAEPAAHGDPADEEGVHPSEHAPWWLGHREATHASLRSFREQRELATVAAFVARSDFVRKVAGVVAEHLDVSRASLARETSRWRRDRAGAQATRTATLRDLRDEVGGLLVEARAQRERTAAALAAERADTLARLRRRVAALRHVRVPAAATGARG